MKHKITIGGRLDDTDAKVTIDVDALIRTKALIQGNSGAGKSGLIRVIVEQIAAKVPTIIIDPESEFASLREKLDMVLVGHQGELAADVRSAGLLARKLAEMGASAILDIYELKGEQRHQFVKAYLEAQIDLPRKLWRPTVVVIDEAQLFAPEKGFGDSAALEAVMDWMFRQRKHGIGSILATPRLSMLNKNVAGANNIFIGRTQLDTDQSRAGKALGMSAKEAIQLRALQSRQFYCYGPALNVDSVTMFRVADCETSIPEPGVHKTLAPPKASHVVEQIADKLKDIQQEAEVEIKTLNDAKAEVSRLNRELRQAKTNQLPREQDAKRIEQLTADLEKARQQTRTETKTVEKKIVIEGSITRLERLRTDLDTPIERLEYILERMHHERSHVAVALTEARELNAANFATAPPKPTPRRTQTRDLPPPRKTVQQLKSELPPVDGELRISSTQQRILDAIAWYESIGNTEPTNIQVGAIALIDATGGHFSNNVGPLSSHGLVARAGGRIRLTAKGLEYAKVPDSIATLEDYHDVLRERVRKARSASGRTVDVLNVIIAANGEPVTNEQIGEAVGIDHTGGHFSNTIGPLSTLGLIKRSQGTVQPTDVLFPPGL